ncbi:TPA: glycosyltransferase family 2 protein [Streptococcus suis]
MKVKRDVTYIIVTWNNEKEIENCLNSIYKFSPMGSKVIIVDNCSTDNTTYQILNKFPDAQLIQNEKNLGFACANNIALELVETQYICYINPDIILTEDIISPSIDALESFPEVGIVASQLRNPDGSHQHSYYNFATPFSMFSEVLHLGKLFPNFMRRRFFLNYYRTNKDFTPDWVIGAEMVLRTKEAKEIDGFSTDYFMYTEDMDICKKMNNILGKKIFYLVNSSLIHIGGASESQNINYSKQQKLFENMKKFVEKYHDTSTSINTIKSMIVAYQVRLFFLKVFYYKYNRKLQIEKSEQAIIMLRKLL